MRSTRGCGDDPVARRFKQVDVFSEVPLSGNPLAVVVDAEGLSEEAMRRFAAWTNLTETAFLLPPTDRRADYRVRIFTPRSEVPFAGHPTLGSCHAWMESGGVPAVSGRVVQECGVGLVEIRRIDSKLTFEAPPRRRQGTPARDLVEAACRVLRIAPSSVVDAAWCDNGIGWLTLMLASAAEVLAVEPDFSTADGTGIGIVGPHPLGLVALHDSPHYARVEVRAFLRPGDSCVEDPATGSLNAAVAQWLVGEGMLDTPYVATQGGAVGRQGRVYLTSSGGSIWVGGDVITTVDGTAKI